MGQDTLDRFFDPKYYQDMDLEMAKFFGHNRIVVFPRWDNIRVPLDYQDFVDIIPRHPFQHISSSLCREKLKHFYQGKCHRSELETLMPSNVVDLIVSQGWYQS